MPVICLIVEDHLLLRQMLCQWLTVVFPDVEFVGVESGEEAVEFARLRPPTVMLMDVHLPGMNGIEATRRIRRMYPNVYTIVHTMHEDAAFRQDARDAGAGAFVSKNNTLDLIPLLTEYLNAHAGRI